MSSLRTRLRTLAALTLAATLVGCAGMPEPKPLRKETIYAVTANHELIHFNAGRPETVLGRLPLVGLTSGETLVGIDYRVARGVLFALSDRGRLYTLDTATATLKQVGSEPIALPMVGPQFGFDFNPAADRIRVVGSGGQNMRLHPDTGAVVDSDPAQPGLQPDTPLAYVARDANAGHLPDVVAAAYTYNKQDEKITTNYAIDRRLGVLVMQGSREGAVPVVSPNSGRLTTVGSLGLPPIGDAAFDIADVTNAAFAAIRPGGSRRRTSLYLIDLATGRAQAIGMVGDGAPVLGMAIEP